MKNNVVIAGKKTFSSPIAIYLGWMVDILKKEIKIIANKSSLK